MKRKRMLLSLNIDKDLHSKFKSKISEKGKKMTEVIISWIKDYINDKETDE